MLDLQNDALSLEYKLDDGCATGYLDLSDVVNNAALQRIGGVFSGRLEEQRGDLLLVREGGPLIDDGGDLTLIRLHDVEALP